jgi:hypothetical protein
MVVLAVRFRQRRLEVAADSVEDVSQSVEGYRVEYTPTMLC